MRKMNAYMVAATVAVVLSAAGGYAQNAMQHDHSVQPGVQAQGMDHQAMMDMQADQKKLDELVAEMNAATGQQKIEKIADVVNELAAREKRMSSMMMMMMHGGTTQMPHGAHH